MQVNCPRCGKSYNLPPRSQGKSATCQGCATRFTIAGQNSKSGSVQANALKRSRPTKATLNAKQLNEMFAGIGEIPRPRVTLAHRFVALFVAGMMLVLPLLYIAFVAGIGWLTW